MFNFGTINIDILHSLILEKIELLLRISKAINFKA